MELKGPSAATIHRAKTKLELAHMLLRRQQWKSRREHKQQFFVQLRRSLCTFPLSLRFI